MALFTLSVWGVLSCGIGASFSPSFLVLGFVFTSPMRLPGPLLESIY